MVQNLSESIRKITDMLDIFGDSTGDYYILYHFGSSQYYFSKNILQAYAIFRLEKTTCTLDEWRERTDSRDKNRLEQIMQDMQKGKYREYNLNYRIKSSNLQTTWINSRGKLYQDENGQPSYLLGRLSISEIVKQAGIFNNTELKNEIKKILKSLRPGYLLLMGIDNLKSINLRNGRDFGDALLKDVIQVIRDEIHHSQKIYRISGDWFAVNLPQYTKENVCSLFQNIQERLIGQCTISGGCVSYTDYHVSDEGMLLQYAEISLDHSKLHGKNMLTFFLPEDYEEKLRELELREDIQKSISAGFEGFALEFQAQVRTGTYDLYGAEALLRYTSPRQGNILPTEFISILEQSDLIYPVGLWAIRESLRYCKKWREKVPQFHISVNMSYSQLNHNSIEEDVLDIVQNSGLPGNALTIEVTESMQLLDYPHLNGIFRRWKKSGIEISVDDFGTGYSSLGRLKEMEIDEIKIDRCFVKGIQKSVYNYQLLSNIIELADSCQIRVCCEGVEEPEELAVLEELRPALIQGFLFANPCSASEFERDCLSFCSMNCRKNKIQDAVISEKEVNPLIKSSEDEIARTILNAENDVFYLSDIDTYELYYLNNAGQKVFGAKDYTGKKCHKVLHGRDTPCEFCTNSNLRQDSFYVWENKNEYCGRHFLLKDKLVSYMGKKVRLEVALDITKQEYISQTAKERLAFADKIVGYMNTLSQHADYPEAVNRVLASLGDFYQADRAYLFERDPIQGDFWDNTFEWCAAGIPSQQKNLQKVPPNAMERWLKVFEGDQSIIIYNLAPLKETSPMEWKILSQQGIQRLIAVPICDNNKIISFLGVDNPRYSIQDDSQMRVLAAFLLTRIRQDWNEQRYQILLQESNQDLLTALHVGFWTLYHNKVDGTNSMIMDETMSKTLGAEVLSSPEEKYTFWYSGIASSDLTKIEQSFKKIIHSNQILQFEYEWNHPKGMRIRLRFSGILIEDATTFIRIKGYCRVL